MAWRNNVVNGLAGFLGVDLAKSDPAPMANRGDQLPGDWITATYGPGWPIQPITRPDEVTVPREIDYPIAVNATLQPRTGYGLMPFEALSTAYETISEIRLPVSTIMRELLGLKPHLVDDDGNEITDHPLRWLPITPDRSVPWDIWLTRFLKSTLIFDAPALHITDNHGNLESLDYIDGSTLFIIVDDKGRIPRPNDVNQSEEVKKRYLRKADEWLRQGKQLPKTTPAYAQVIKGTPFGWYDSDQIWYRPVSRRFNAPYGESPIEQSWAWVLVCANITSFELAHYREGNMPEGWAAAPEGWSLEKINAFEQAFNGRMSSGPAERMRMRVLPYGFTWQETKRPEFPEKLYDRARDNIALAYGVPPSEFGKMPGQGLGGKGFADAMQSALFRNALMPRVHFVENCLNSILDRFGVDDVHFELALETDSVDPEVQKQNIVKLFSAGLLSLNDALGQMSLSPVPGGDIHIVVQGGQVIVLEDTLKQYVQPSQSQINSENPLPEKQPGPTGQSDVDTAKQILQTAEETGSASKALFVHPRQQKGQFANVGKFPKANPQGAEAIDPAQFRAGFKEEKKEHGSNFRTDDIKQIVVDHLKEDPSYYSKRYKVEGSGPYRVVNIDNGKTVGTHETKEQANAHMRALYANVPDVQKVSVPLLKHCGVCIEDDAYFGAPLAREMTFSFPASHHANDVEVVAAVPEGLPPRPAVWKPEGGETEILRMRIGGPLYVREEAAYLLDRALGFYLVPVSWVSEVDEEHGAAMLYVMGNEPSNDVDTYSPAWVEKAGVLDYIMSQTDRNTGNWLTHPDDPERPVLIDNGLGFPVGQFGCYSPFCQAMLNKPLSIATLNAIKQLIGDAATWQDINTLIGPDATKQALICAQRLLDKKAITSYEDESDSSTDETQPSESESGS